MNTGNYINTNEASGQYHHLQTINNSNNNFSIESLNKNTDMHSYSSIQDNIYMNHLQHNMNQQVYQSVQGFNIDAVEDIKMELEDKDLWTLFYNLTNEMILTKAGRRTFPLVKIRMNGLEDNSLYTVEIEFRISDTYKYRFVNGEWKTSPRNDPKQAPPAITYKHADSPNFGHHWCKKAVEFEKLKLTNNENKKNNDAVFLRSLNKYDPVIHIYKHDQKNVDNKMRVFSKFFKETQFIAVTAYQNEKITQLKITHNPYAKAFLNNNKPMITIDSNDVIKSIQQNTVPIKSEPKKQTIQSKNTLPVQNMLNSNQNIPNIQPTKSENVIQEQNLIQNWYNAYYPVPQRAVASQPQPSQQLTLPTQRMSPVTINQNTYQNQFYDYQQNYFNTNYSQIPFNPYTYSNDYMYQANLYNQQYNYNQNTLCNQDFSNQNSTYNQSVYSYDSIPLGDSELCDRSKQSSPIYEDFYIKKSSSNKRSLNDNRVEPYTTSRPAKRANTSNDILAVSPVQNHNSNINKIELNDDSDNSLNSIDQNFLTSQYQNQTYQTPSSLSVSSFMASSSSSSVSSA